MDTNPSEPNVNKEPSYDRFEARHQRREERHAARGGAGGWIGGVIFILIGALLLFQNFGGLVLNNWWALFILIPAVGAFANAWRSYQASGGHLNAAARGSLIGGLVLVMVTAIFLFNLNWGLLGPVLLVLAGLGILLNTTLP